MAIQDKATYIAQKNIDFANNTSQLITPTIQRTDRQNLAESLAWLSDTNTYTGQQRFNKGADVASATVLPLISDGNYFDVTGTVTVTSFADLGGAGTVIILQFDAACILTHHATNLILPTGGNITTAAGDTAIFVNYASGDYRCLSYQRADGTSLVGGDVTKVGTPVNNQVGVWTGDGTLEGDSKLTFDGTTLGVTGGGTFAGDVTITGANALRGSYGAGGITTNFAAGDSALSSNTTGDYNTAIGGGALQDNTTGSYNTVSGVNALKDNTVGVANTAIGFEALKDNTVGVANTAIGSDALGDNTTGGNNTANGYNTGIGITTGSGNTVLGANVTGLAAGLTNNIILANGTGAIKAQHDGTDWAFTGRATFSSSVTTVSNAGFILNYTVDASSRSWVIKNDQSLFGDFQIQQSTTQTGTIRTTKFYISPSGNIGIGNSNDTYKLDVSGTANLTGALSGTSATFSGRLNADGNIRAAYLDYVPSGVETFIIGKAAYNVFDGNQLAIGTFTALPIEFATNNVKRLTIASTGAATFSGSVSKASGSFKIDHPLESKKDTHHLVHSFVESPQANNIYRGKAQLENGIAEVNLDEVSTMTEGTFVALNTDIHCFTSNESDWDAVKGSVEGNILTIECQNNQSSASVNWLVIGERHDKHMMETEWTDENGKVIVEPLKPVEPEPVEEVEPTPSDDDLE
jgi:hypothetical protein